MKHRISLTLATLAIAFALAGSAQAFVCGDADASADVTISDAVYLISFIFSGGPAPAPIQSGDPDCSDDANISDAVYLIAYIFLGGPAPCCPGAILYVHAGAGGPGDGTAANPYKLLSAAIADAAGDPLVQDIYLSKDSIFGAITDTAEVDITGGFNAGSWTPSGVKTVIVSPASVSLLTASGFLIRDVGTTITISNVKFLATSPANASVSSYAARVVNSLVAFSWCDFRSGNGVSGLAGFPGGVGSIGGNGSAGANGTANGSSGGTGGAGGVGGLNGGAGGSGGYGNGSGANGLVGGGGTTGGNGTNSDGCSAGGNNAFSGLNGAAGINGAPGSAMGAHGSYLTFAGYVANAGSGGGSGLAGHGGGGGGGGGGGEALFLICMEDRGGGGGGGGGSGRPGNGGQGGERGGSSIVVVSDNSTISLVNCNVLSGSGGNGGNGGSGGSGGPGGAGGSGGTGPDDSGEGGDGGNGGAGGSGGGGGGGAGGHAICVLLANGGSYANVSGNTFVFGMPGFGGSGGVSLSPGPSGLTGTAAVSLIIP